MTRQIGFELFDIGQHDQARKMWIASLAMGRDADPDVMPVRQARTIETWSTNLWQVVTISRH